MEKVNNEEYLYWLKQGKDFQGKSLLNDAITCYKKALSFFPDSVETLAQLGIAYHDIGQIKQAVDTFHRVIELAGDDAPAFVRARLLILTRDYIFWDHWDDDVVNYTLSDDFNIKSDGMVHPYYLLSTPMDNRQQYHAISAYIRRNFNEKPFMFSFKDRSKNQEKIRLGFLCGDFRPAPKGYMLGEFFELIDRNKFEVYLYDTHPQPETEESKRIYSTTPHICNVEGMNDEQAAKKIFEDKIDVLIELTGYTGYQRFGILVYRPAVAQGTFLGQLLTTGGIPECQYNFADKYALPPDQQPYYSEKLKYLEPTHRVYDCKVKISPSPMLRSSVNIASDAIVLCCFNNTCKFTPNYFDLWARILKRVPKAILWFYTYSNIARQNIISEFEKRGIDFDRLVFCNNMAHEVHLRRYEIADLLLDTEWCNAHTTALDALYMGCPIVTCPGKTFASRACGSILNALGMSELICKDVKEYEEKVVKLCTTPGALKKLRQKTIEKVKTSDVFKTEKFTRSFEKACKEMFEESLDELNKL